MGADFLRFVYISMPPLLFGHLCGYSQHTLDTYGLTKKGACGCIFCYTIFAFLLAGQLYVYTQRTLDTHGFHQDVGACDDCFKIVCLHFVFSSYT